MIGDDQVEGAVAESLPQSLPLGAPANRGSALVGRGAVRDLLGREGEVVGAGLAGEVLARRDRASCLNRRDMEYVGGSARLGCRVA